MQLLKFGILPFVALGLFAQPVAADTTLVATEIRNMETCLKTLQEFNWICQEFNHGGWVRRYGRTFWKKGRLFTYRHDVDGDGIDDAIVKVEHVGLCSRGGPVCAHYFLFGDQPASKHPHVDGAMGNGPIVLLNINGIESLYFQRFPEREKNYLYTIEEIRSNTLKSRQRSINPRGVGE